MGCLQTHTTVLGGPTVFSHRNSPPWFNGLPLALLPWTQSLWFQTDQHRHLLWEFSFTRSIGLQGALKNVTSRQTAGAREQQQHWRPGPALTWTLLIQLRTATKEHSAVMSYITRIPSAFRKYCLVTLRNLSPDKPKAPSEPRDGIVCLSVSAGALQVLAAPVRDVSLRAGVYTQVTDPCAFETGQAAVGRQESCQMCGAEKARRKTFAGQEERSRRISLGGTGKGNFLLKRKLVEKTWSFSIVWKNLQTKLHHSTN